MIACTCTRSRVCSSPLTRSATPTAPSICGSVRRILPRATWAFFCVPADRAVRWFCAQCASTDAAAAAPGPNGRGVVAAAVQVRHSRAACVSDAVAAPSHRSRLRRQRCLARSRRGRRITFLGVGTSLTRLRRRRRTHAARPRRDCRQGFRRIRARPEGGRTCSRAHCSWRSH